MSHANFEAIATVKLTRGVCALMVSWLMLPIAAAGEIQSLTWASGTDEPTLEVRVVGEAAYELQTLEDGQRARLSFPGSTLGNAVSELPGLKHVKGVYPYLANGGATVNVDLLLNEPGQLNVAKVAYGYAVVVSPSAAMVSDRAQTEAATDASPAAKNAIQEMVYAKLPGDRIQLTLRMTQTPVEPNAFATANPARVALDFPNTQVKLASKTLPVREGAVVSATAIEAEGRSRVVLSLVKPVSYTTSIDGNNYVITFNAPPSTIAATDQPKTTHFASSRKTGKYALKAVDFRRGSQGDGKIIINLSDPTVGVDIREQAGEIVIDFQNTSVAPELQRRLDVVDFATPVQTIDTFVQGTNTRMVISPKGRYEHIAYQTGDVFTVSVKPIIEKSDEKKVDEFGYSGEKLSLNFQNIDVRAALQVLADFTGLNFVVSDTVKGSLTLRLKDVPWDQALDLVVDAKNLAVRRKGNVITVAPAAEVAAKEKAAFEASKSLIELEPLVSELVQISYAKADEIATLLKSIQQASTPATNVTPIPVLGAPAAASTASTTGANTLLSPRGQVTVDARTNSLLIQDIPGKIREVRKLIAQLDQPVRQVLIETRLVEAQDNFARSLGVRFGVKTANLDNPSGNQRAVSGTIVDSSSIVSAGGVVADSTGLNVNLGSGGVGGKIAASIGLTVAKLGANGDLLNLELSALEQEGAGKIISSPRVITANQKKAKIEQGQERVFVAPGGVGGSGSFTTKKATLKLEVTPQITPDDRVNLDVNITKDNFADSVQGLLNIKEINTQVLLDNGETVVIGGIYEQDSNDTVTKVPLFGDIPLLGWLFKTKDVRDNKTELLIFLTPRIVAENLTLR